ncbi:ABC transporter [Cordyceps javanica]|uniref:ABC transporter n=1 Tax=Cordyceps javanica TaxID=43265 RepID=A0A545UZH0_9HYPO|nr:ABC transporter [Cordyceps javanica]TQW06714.1 ABC transporter [Cordyceps javanica]
MGKPSDLAAPYKDDNNNSHPTTPLGEAASSISMHRPNPNSPRRQQYFDSDFDVDAGAGAVADEPPHAEDDLPPLYSDHDLDAIPAATAADPLIPRGTPNLDVAPFRSSDKSGKTYLLDRRLDTDPAFLQRQLEILAESPPRPLCHVRGTHTETRRRGDKEEQETVVDFDVEVELTGLLYTDARTGASWRQLTAVGNLEKVRRGTVLAKRAPGFGGSGGGSGQAETGTPTVQEWCHRYCASSAGLKSFALERRVTGWDFEHLERKLQRLVRDTNYQGHLRVDFPVHNSRVEIYNECRTSRWRLTKWIEVLCYATLAFLVTWPWLFFRTKRWETVYVAWPLRDPRTGRYASLSEDQWYNMWARAIQTACLARRQGVLDQGDLASSLQQHPAGGDAAAGGFAGVVQAGVDAMAVVNRSFGWGGDDNRHGGFNRRARLPNLGRNRC